MKNLKKFLPLFCLVLPAVGFAQTDGSSYASSNTYIEANVGWARFGSDVFGMKISKNGWGANANLGYQFNKYFAVEGGYTYYNVSHGRLSTVDAAVKGILPLGAEDRFKLFAKLGPGYALTSGDDDNKWLLFGGVGVGYGLTDNLDVTLQVQGQTVVFADFSLVSLGVTYHF